MGSLVTLAFGILSLLIGLLWDRCRSLNVRIKELEYAMEGKEPRKPRELSQEELLMLTRQAEAMRNVSRWGN